MNEEINEFPIYDILKPDNHVYLVLDENEYLCGTLFNPNGLDAAPDLPFVDSIDGFDLSGNRIFAYRWDGEKLVLDEERLTELLSEQDQAEAEMRRIMRKEAARFEITDAVLTATINSVVVDDTTALRWIDFYPEWSGGNPYTVGFKVNYDDRLWRCIQAHTSQVGWEPVNVPALWEEICESHSGTIDDPIPYSNNMTLENGKYYS